MQTMTTEIWYQILYGFYRNCLQLKYWLVGVFVTKITKIVIWSTCLCNISSTDHWWGTMCFGGFYRSSNTALICKIICCSIWDKVYAAFMTLFTDVWRMFFRLFCYSWGYSLGKIMTKVQWHYSVRTWWLFLQKGFWWCWCRALSNISLKFSIDVQFSWNLVRAQHVIYIISVCIKPLLLLFYDWGQHFPGRDHGHQDRNILS